MTDETFEKAKALKKELSKIEIEILELENALNDLGKDYANAKPSIRVNAVNYEINPKLLATVIKTEITQRIFNADLIRNEFSNL